MTGARLKLEVEARIRATYLDSKRGVFWPDQFVDAGLGSLEEIVTALHELAKEDRLEAVAQIRCDEGHVTWSGTPAEYTERFAGTLRARAPRCTTCGSDTSELAEQTYLHFKLSGAWRAALDTEKKSLQTSLTF